MGIKPALGWLALLLFTTTAQAEGARDLLKVAPRGKLPPVVTSVTPKTKAPPLRTVAAVSQEAALAVVEVSGRPKADIELSSVFMMFERERRATFRIGRDRIKRVVRLASDPKLDRHDHVDVVDTEDGVFAIDTSLRGTQPAIDVYVFGSRTTLDQRIGALESVPTPMRERIREALVAAVWTR